MPCKEEEDEVNAYLLTIAFLWWRCKANFDILKTRRKKKIQEFLWSIHLFVVYLPPRMVVN